MSQRSSVVWRGLRTTVMVVTILAGAASVSYATTLVTADPAAAEIHACRMKIGGLLRVVADTNACNPRVETPISWNAQGIKGDAGPAGPPGAKGDIGPVGPAGTDFDPTRLYIATATVVTQDDLSNSAGYVAASCNPGDALISGGFHQPFQAQAKIEGSFPENRLIPQGPNQTQVRWLVQYQYGAAGQEVDAYAICYRMTE